jgi:hypothetical protein
VERMDLEGVLIGYEEKVEMNRNQMLLSGKDVNYI